MFKSHNFIISKDQKFFMVEREFWKLKNIIETNNPKLSIITVVLNGEKHLEDIKSVLNQSYKNFGIYYRWSLIDQTLEIIKQYNNQIEYWVSEKDKGIYDAFNKGMMLAKGDYIGIANSDDVYVDGAFEILDKYINKFPDKDFIFGSVKHWDFFMVINPGRYIFHGIYSSHSTGFFI